MSEADAAPEAVVLRYRAYTDSYFMGVPARDLTEDDLERVVASGRFGKTKPTALKRLVESGLYTAAARKSAATAADREAN